MPTRTSVFLNVNDLEKSIEFYKVLGFKVAKEWKEEGKVDYVDLELGDAEIGLGRIGANDEPSFRNWVSTPLGAGVLVQIEVPDVTTVWPKIQKARLDVEAPLSDRPYGKTVMLNDPDGYSLIVHTPPKKAAKRSKPAKKAAKGRAKAAKKARKARR